MKGTARRGTGSRPGGLTPRMRKAVAAVAAMTLGFSGAAVIDALFLAPGVAAAEELGPGDGLTRLVVTVPGGVAAEQVAALDALPGVDSAQPLFDGSALVAGAGITADAMRTVVPGAEVTLSVPGEVAGRAISDPYWSSYGWNLENTGTNAYRHAASAGADVSAPTGWQAGTGRGLVVAVTDTGFTPSHPDMAGALWTNPDESCGSTDGNGNGKAGDCHGWNFYRNSPDITNGGDNEHGTAVSGIVGARAGNGEGTAGVAPDVTIMPLVVGGGESVDLYAGAQAIKYAADNGADVVNASWISVEDSPGAAAILTDAIAYADSKGVVVVAAAGNDSGDRDTARRYPASIDAPNLITVGSSTATDSVAGHSAYGARTVDLFAPGEGVFVTWNDGTYRIGDGTSFASPHVAAAVALYRAHDRTATPAELEAELLSDVQHLPAFAGRSVTGGRLALDDLGNGVAPVSYTFSDMAADAGTVGPQVVASGSAPAGVYEVRLALGMEHGREVYALTEHPITLDGVSVPTDDEGEATFSLGSRSGLGSVVLSPTTELHDGRYVLTAQLYLDGSPLGLAYAAPLLVGDEARKSAPQPGPPTPGTPVPTPGSQAPDGTSPDDAQDTTGPGSDAPDGDRPDAGDPGSPGPDDESRDTPGTGSPGPDSPGTSDPETPGGNGTPSPGTDTPRTDYPDSSGPGTDGPETADPNPNTGTPAPDPGTPPPDTPAPGTERPTDPVPDLGGKKEYPGVGPFRLTSISPTRVSTAGGTQVVVTGLAIPEGATVRIGGTARAQVSEALSSSARLTFTTPALVAGTYDVYVFGPDRSSSVLTAGLTYVAADGSSPVPGAD